ncbi:Gfo/Idh/MocA family protein [Ornithinimicrobium sp. INDO-MA30-4]|uniref:Gfo/Idh/MocA family protein n=1 Tax=Ornithinimicrobium sp. INDO-MA30-4 TaxID=2908651 RepID=UPI001F437A0A|nr:Gfo/Idh/MocA family oxidoreductase [Ornithinimicrobium sp. INDO-MA30-4]UJH71328.1 Gfo/Idh/MocA family oxidoreductase [Ornithinimicrobium sp. INDO-MA30-4]
MKAIKVALVGYGQAGRRIHAPLIEQAGGEVVAVVTTNADRIEQVHAELADAAVVPTLEELLADRARLGYDCIVLATPGGLHAEQAEQILDAGVPLVVDKPLAVDASAALGVVDAARNKAPLTVFNNRRFDRDFATLRSVVESGQLGEVLRSEMRWERWRPEGTGMWREHLSAAEGGGLMLDLHAHTVDSAVQLWGPIDSVYAEIQARSTEAEDDAFMSCRHASGVVSHLSVSNWAAVPGPRWRVLGSAGSYVVASVEGEPVAISELADQDEQHCGWFFSDEGRSSVVVAKHGQQGFYEEFFAALALPADDVEGRQAAMPVNPSDAVHVLAVLDAARRAAVRGSVETVITPGVAPGAV